MNNRTKKFKAKLDAEHRGKLFDLQKEEMVKKEAEATKGLVRIEMMVKEIIDGEPSILHHYYMVFAKEIYSKARKHKGLNLYNEIMILETKWESRGLTPWLLEIIKNISILE